MKEGDNDMDYMKKLTETCRKVLDAIFNSVAICPVYEPLLIEKVKKLPF